MGADGVDLSFYASQAFLRDWKSAFPTMKDCAVSKVDLLRRRAASSVDWLHHYDTVELPERLGRCIEIEIGRADRLIARVDGADVTFVGIGDHEITGGIKNRLTGREREDAVDPPLELIEGPVGLFLPWDDSATERGGIITYGPAVQPNWAYYLSEQQVIIRDRIWEDVERLVLHDHWERGTHVVMGGPGTGKTSILLSLLDLLDGPSIEHDDWSIGLRVSPQMREFIERHTGWDLERVCDAIDTPRDLDIILVDDPATVADVEKWINFGNTKNSAKRRPLVVVGFDPLQLGGELPDAMLDDFSERRGVSLHWVTSCYRQKEVPGRLALDFARQAGEANPYGERTKMRSYSERFREVYEMVHGLTFENHSGWAKAYPDATAGDWRDYAGVVIEALATEREAWQRETADADAPARGLFAWPPCLVVQVDGAEIPDEWSSLLGDEAEGVLVNTRSTSAWSDEIKGLEYQHVAVVMPNASLHKLLAPQPPAAMGPMAYGSFRLLRIPFSRARDTLAVFGV